MAKFSDTLYRLSYEKATELLPVIVILAILMVIGFVGNPLVIYFFGFRTKPKPSFLFIVALACFDFLACVMSTPLEIVDIVHYYTFENAGLCKVFQFVNYIASLGSGFTLIAIAVDRYRKVCTPFKPQITRKIALVTIGSIFLGSVAIASPSLWFYDTVAVNITEVPFAVGQDCTTKRDASYVTPITVFNLFTFFLFISAIVVLIVIYSLVGRKLIKMKHKGMFAKRRIVTEDNVRNTSSTGLDSLTDSEIVRNGKESNDVIFLNKTFRKSVEQASVTEDNSIEKESTESNRALEKSKELECKKRNSQQMKKERKRSSSNVQRAIKVRKYTVVMLCITVAFILSYLPVLSLLTWRTFAEYEPNLIHGASLVFYELFVRSQLFNSAINPIIYGFLNKDFKTMVVDQVKYIVCRFCQSKKQVGKDLTGTKQSVGSIAH